MRSTGPLFQFDPGWLFVSAGLLVCAAGVLLPAQADLRALEAQLAQLHAEEARAYQRLAAHADFIDQVERSDPAIIKRLAAAQLNLVPEGDTPLLLSSADASPVTDWIDATVKLDIRPVRMAGLSTLSQWTSGPQRLWMFGAGIMAVFMGLLIAPAGMRRRRRAAASASVGDVVGVTGWHEARESVRESAMVSAMNDDDRASGAGERSRGSVSLWIDEDMSERDEFHASADMIDSLVPATLDAEEHEVSQIADTVDLEPDELLMTPVTRTVIADKGRVETRDAAGEVTRVAAATEVKVHDALAAKTNDIDLTVDAIDAREGLGAGVGSPEADMSAEDLESGYAGTGLLDAAESHDCGVPEPDVDIPGSIVDVESHAAGEVAIADAPAMEADADDIAAEARAHTEEPVAGADCEENGSESRRKHRGGTRRRPRRTKRRQARDGEGTGEAPNEQEADPTIQSAIDGCASVEPDDQSRTDEDVVAKGAAIEDRDVGDDAGPELDDDDDAASIPFLRRRGRGAEQD